MIHKPRLFGLKYWNQLVCQQTHCILHDITQQKSTEEALRESEERLEFVLKGSQLGFWDWNLETNEVKRNERWAEMLGYKLQDIEFTVKQWLHFVHC
jgi:PAS domain-containing protein